MRCYSLFTLFTLTILCVVQSAPVPLELGKIHGHDDLEDGSVNPHPGSADHLANIQAAVNTAHTQIMKMKTMMDTNDPHLHDHLVNVFGENYNKEEIKKVVDKMATGKLNIGTVNLQAQPVSGQVTVAQTSSKGGASRTSFTSEFHRMTPEAQAGVMVHEASHAFGSTKDHFSADGTKTLTNKEVNEGTPSKSGYLEKEFVPLKATSPIMHKNADSYKVFAHTAANGLHAPLPEKYKSCGSGQKKSTPCVVS